MRLNYPSLNEEDVPASTPSSEPELPTRQQLSNILVCQGVPRRARALCTGPICRGLNRFGRTCAYIEKHARGGAGAVAAAR